MSRPRRRQRSVADGHRNAFQEGLVLVNEIPTPVLTYGGWMDEIQTNFDKKIIILVIPGNPGNVEYYQQFMETIYQRLKGQFPVWGICHLGHTKVPEQNRIPPLSGNKDLYSVQGQVEHKLAFINHWIPKDISLILIGHSIGTYIALQLMQRLPEQRILKSILLFPTVEKLADSPIGKWAWPLLAYCRPIAVAAMYVLSFLSTPMQQKIIEWYFSGYKLPVPACACSATVNIADSQCVSKYMYMAHNEMEVVLQLDTELIRSNLKRLIFYYGASDGFCPTLYYEDMKKLFPEGNIMLCDRGFDHAFILQSGVQVGELVSQWIGEEFGLKLDSSIAEKE